ncbi:MAG: M24 family metallopeptidase [Gemmatimonadetes bacterium]|nr:M24 family metallopeptidase [Gemmatimonadota bacterium]
MRLSEANLAAVQAAIAESKVDGWLLYDFRGLNPIAAELVGVEGLATRRIFAFIPRAGTPVGIAHAIEPGPWRHWPAAWPRTIYSGWRALEAALADVVKGKTVAMEYAPGDGVPYVDRVPAGVIEMVRAAGATVVTSADLVSRCYAGWSGDQLAAHERAAEQIAAIAKAAIQRAGDAARAGTPIMEHVLKAWILERFDAEGLMTDHGPTVAVGAHAADPHYEPDAARALPIASGNVLLIDLFAKDKSAGIWADQTWIGAMGTPAERVVTVWNAVRDARDAAIALLSRELAAGRPVTGGAADNAARQVITERGFGPYFTHRTGHSIDARDLHGSGPNLDDMETRDDRALLPGVAFSVEPGVYLTGDFGIRSEVNAIVKPGALHVTPKAPQRELIVVG